MPIQTLSTKIEPPQVGRCDLVVQSLTSLSRSRVRGLFDHDCVSINGRVCKSTGEPVSQGDLVTVRFDPQQGYKEKKKAWDDRTFSLVFEDDHLVVVDKAAGVLTVPTDHGEKNTLVERVSHYISYSRPKRLACIVHRLDREVSGLLVMAKNETIAERLIEQFKDRKPERIYAAIVAGVVAKDSDTIQTHLATRKNLDRFSVPEAANTELAITHYVVVRRMMDTTLLNVRLETGRRNQIRVHLSELGHSVLGDPRYGGDVSDHPRWIRRRMALHAQTLGFEHPITGEPLKFESELPIAMVKFIRGSR
jgi:23S rRNA pseudouridine1911/1915/1917 synthase